MSDSEIGGQDDALPPDQEANPTDSKPEGSGRNPLTRLTTAISEWVKTHVARETKRTFSQTEVTERIFGIIDAVQNGACQRFPGQEAVIRGLAQLFYQGFSSSVQTYCPPRFATDLDLVPVENLCRNICDPAEREPAPSEIERWMMEDFETRFAEAMRGLKEQMLRSPDSTSEPNSMSKRQLLGEVEAARGTMETQISGLTHRPRGVTARSATSDGVSMMQNLIVRDCPDPIRIPADLQPFKAGLRRVLGNLHLARSPYEGSATAIWANEGMRLAETLEKKASAPPPPPLSPSGPPPSPDGMHTRPETTRPLITREQFATEWAEEFEQTLASRVPTEHPLPPKVKEYMSDVLVEIQASIIRQCPEVIRTRKDLFCIHASAERSGKAVHDLEKNAPEGIFRNFTHEEYGLLTLDTIYQVLNKKIDALEKSLPRFCRPFTRRQITETYLPLLVRQKHAVLQDTLSTDPERLSLIFEEVFEKSLPQVSTCAGDLMTLKGRRSSIESSVQVRSWRLQGNAKSQELVETVLRIFELIVEDIEQTLPPERRTHPIRREELIARITDSHRALTARIDREPEWTKAAPRDALLSVVTNATSHLTMVAYATMPDEIGLPTDIYPLEAVSLGNYVDATMLPTSVAVPLAAAITAETRGLREWMTASLSPLTPPISRDTALERFLPGLIIRLETLVQKNPVPETILSAQGGIDLAKKLLAFLPEVIRTADDVRVITEGLSHQRLTAVGMPPEWASLGEAYTGELIRFGEHLQRCLANRPENRVLTRLELLDMLDEYEQAMFLETNEERTESWYRSTFDHLRTIVLGLPPIIDSNEQLLSLRAALETSRRCETGELTTPSHLNFKPILVREFSDTTEAVLGFAEARIVPASTPAAAPPLPTTQPERIEPKFLTDAYGEAVKSATMALRQRGGPFEEIKKSQRRSSKAVGRRNDQRRRIGSYSSSLGQAVKFLIGKQCKSGITTQEEADTLSQGITHLVDAGGTPIDESAFFAPQETRQIRTAFHQHCASATALIATEVGKLPSAADLWQPGIGPDPFAPPGGGPGPSPAEEVAEEIDTTPRMPIGILYAISMKSAERWFMHKTPLEAVTAELSANNAVERFRASNERLKAAMSQLAASLGNPFEESAMEHWYQRAEAAAEQHRLDIEQLIPKTCHLVIQNERRILQTTFETVHQWFIGRGTALRRAAADPARKHRAMMTGPELTSIRESVHQLHCLSEPEKEGLAKEIMARGLEETIRQENGEYDLREIILSARLLDHFTLDECEAFYAELVEMYEEVLQATRNPSTHCQRIRESDRRIREAGLERVRAWFAAEEARLAAARSPSELDTEASLAPLETSAGPEQPFIPRQTVIDEIIAANRRADERSDRIRVVAAIRPIPATAKHVFERDLVRRVTDLCPEELRDRDDLNNIIYDCLGMIEAIGTTGDPAYLSQIKTVLQEEFNNAFLNLYRQIVSLEVHEPFEFEDTDVFNAVRMSERAISEDAPGIIMSRSDFTQEALEALRTFVHFVQRKQQNGIDAKSSCSLSDLLSNGEKALASFINEWCPENICTRLPIIGTCAFLSQLLSCLTERVTADEWREGGKIMVSFKSRVTKKIRAKVTEYSREFPAPAISSAGSPNLNSLKSSEAVTLTPPHLLLASALPRHLSFTARREFVRRMPEVEYVFADDAERAQASEAGHRLFSALDENLQAATGTNGPLQALQNVLVSFDTTQFSLPPPIANVAAQAIEAAFDASGTLGGVDIAQQLHACVRSLLAEVTNPTTLPATLPLQTRAETMSDREKIDAAAAHLGNGFVHRMIHGALSRIPRTEIALPSGTRRFTVSSNDFSVGWIPLISGAVSQTIAKHLESKPLGRTPRASYLQQLYAGQGMLFVRAGQAVQTMLGQLQPPPPAAVLAAMRAPSTESVALPPEGAAATPENFDALIVDQVLSGRDPADPFYPGEAELIEQFCITVLDPHAGDPTDQLLKHSDELAQLAASFDGRFHAGIPFRSSADQARLVEMTLPIAASVLAAKGSESRPSSLGESVDSFLPPRVHDLRHLCEENEAWMAGWPTTHRQQAEELVLETVRDWHESACVYVDRCIAARGEVEGLAGAELNAACVRDLRANDIVKFVRGPRGMKLVVDKVKWKKALGARRMGSDVLAMSGAHNAMSLPAWRMESLQTFVEACAEEHASTAWLAVHPDRSTELGQLRRTSLSIEQEIGRLEPGLRDVEGYLRSHEEWRASLPSRASTTLEQIGTSLAAVEAALSERTQALAQCKHRADQVSRDLASYSGQGGHDPARLQAFSQRIEAATGEVFSVTHEIEMLTQLGEKLHKAPDALSESVRAIVGPGFTPPTASAVPGTGSTEALSQESAAVLATSETLQTECEEYALYEQERTALTRTLDDLRTQQRTLVTSIAALAEQQSERDLRTQALAGVKSTLNAVSSTLHPPISND